MKTFLKVSVYHLLLYHIHNHARHGRRPLMQKGLIKPNTQIQVKRMRANNQE